MSKTRRRDTDTYTSQYYIQDFVEPWSHLYLLLLAHNWLLSAIY